MEIKAPGQHGMLCKNRASQAVVYKDDTQAAQLWRAQYSCESDTCNVHELKQIQHSILQLIRSQLKHLPLARQETLQSVICEDHQCCVVPGRPLLIRCVMRRLLMHTLA